MPGSRVGSNGWQCERGAASLPRLDDVLPASSGGTVLRRFRSDDLVRFHAYRSDAELAAYQGWSVMSVEEATRFVLQMAAVAILPRGDWVQLAIADAAADELQGDVGVHVDADGRAAEIGFTLSRQAQGRGHATRAVRSTLSLLFASTAIELVRAVTDARNAPSIRLLARTGFAQEAARQALFKGEHCTEFTYVCRRGET
jgi:RimJ/RimL family protein N-acetyltransferase